MLRFRKDPGTCARSLNNLSTCQAQPIRFFFFFFFFLFSLKKEGRERLQRRNDMEKEDLNY